MARSGEQSTFNSGWPAWTNGGNDERDGTGEQRPGSRGQNGRESPTAVFNPYYTGRPKTPASDPKRPSIDRQEIIRKIKSRESRPTSPELERIISFDSVNRLSQSVSAQDRVDDARPMSSRQDDAQSAGMEIERPRSALHKGDFRDKEDTNGAFQRFGESQADPQVQPSLSTSPVAPWHPEFPAAIFRQVRQELPRPPSPPPYFTMRPPRVRAASRSSLAASFVYRAPTSPLVQSSRPDTPESPSRRGSRSPDRSRRHTFSPSSLQQFRSALDYPASARQQSEKPPPILRSEQTFPYQAHQPRQSLNSLSLPQTPRPSTRRPSVAESGLHHAPMVGSYEESILRGRMSTTPSKPLNFVAQIGVLGKGSCKPSLRCPPHVTIPFPAVFYSYGAAAKVTDQPSPYVGHVDLENNLPPAEPSPEKPRRHRLHRSIMDEDGGSRSSSCNRDDGSASDARARRRRKAKEQRRRSRSPKKAPPGGAYRIPQQGQLQIIIKNPHKTAVKLYLVPYDLSDMEPGTKTFIRQRSYSAGPIIDMPLSSRKNLGTDRPEASLSASEDPNDRPVLRYLCHINICCTGKGRYWLYGGMRVVFANRVPDGKEKLRNEIQLPEPKYSAYKPNKDALTPKSSAAKQRHNPPFEPGTTPPLPPSPMNLDGTPPYSQQHSSRRYFAKSLPKMDSTPNFSFPPPPLPLNGPTFPAVDSRPASRQTSEGMDLDSDQHSWETPSNRSTISSSFSPRALGAHTTRPMSPLDQQLESVRKLEDPFNFERDHSRERKPGIRSESLLSKRLMDLAVQKTQALAQAQAARQEDH